MKNDQISDEELQFYFNFLMKNHDVLNVQDFSNLNEDSQQYSEEELALEVV